ncbi:hypothetical protein [Hymenobacter sp. B81]|uniref:alpha/beta hydrolase n=1 Tax=Hymenobacter sp. B81 TaxID=3344878 RepID=UPI0037DD292C
MNRFVLLLCGSLLVGSTACGTAGPPPGAELPVPALSLPTPTGSFGVGRTFGYWTDAARGRELPVWVYYPTAKTAAAPADSVLPRPAWAARYRELVARRLGLAAATALLNLRTSARTEAPVAATAEPLPVLLFAPGLHWLPTDYSTLLEELASQGYVVVAWAPPQFAGVVQNSAGQLVEGTGSHDHRVLAADFGFVRRQLGQLQQNPDSPLRGRLALSRVGALGHSIGGAATVGAALADPGIVAVANLDGDFDGAEVTGGLRQPILYLTTEPPGLQGQPVDAWDDDRSEKRRLGVWQQVKARSAQAYRVRLPGLYHSNFQDAALLPAAAVPDKLRQSRFGPADGARGLRLSAQLLTAFFDAQLRGAPADQLTGLRAAYPEIRLEVSRP